MNTMRRWPWLPIAALGLTLAAMTGCTTWIPSAGVTLPSGGYLMHPPQYIPTSPSFPLENEQATQAAIAARPAGAGVLPPPVVGGGGP